MYVVATAGHVDHGKSTLVNALTGMEPDRWEEEQRRGLTIDLGFAWTKLPSGREVSFVDVPGHERFLANMLAGVGPAPVICFVVAADQGWQQQSTDHFDAITALGIQHGIIALTRCDLAPDRVAETIEVIRHNIAETALADCDVVPVSAKTGEGLELLREKLDELLGQVPAPDVAGRFRMWLDRSFSITGAGTVVTGTLASGTLTVGEELNIHTKHGVHKTVVRGLQSRNTSVDTVQPYNRVAVNLRGVSVDDVGRGDALLKGDQWPIVTAADVRTLPAGRRSAEDQTRFEQWPNKVTVHIGTASTPAHLRAFDQAHARLTLESALPLQVGDRLILRVPGSHLRIAGVEILDVAPPELVRRGDGVRRQAELAAMPSGGDYRAQVQRRGLVSAANLQEQGLHVPADLDDGFARIGEYIVAEEALQRWTDALEKALAGQAEKDPLAPGLTRSQASHAVGIQQGPVLEEVIRQSGAQDRGGTLLGRGVKPTLGKAERAIADLEKRLTAAPFDAPEADELHHLGLGAKELAAAAQQGRIMRLEPGIVLLPKAPALAMRELARLPQPFTTSQARQALGTTRRIAIPLLEHLDERGWTEQVEPGKRMVAR